MVNDAWCWLTLNPQLSQLISSQDEAFAEGILRSSLQWKRGRSGNSSGIEMYWCTEQLYRNMVNSQWLYVGREVWNMFLDNSLGVDIWWHGASSWCRNGPIDYIFARTNPEMPTLFVSDVQLMPVWNGQGFVTNDIWHFNSLDELGQLISQTRKIARFYQL